MNAVLLSAEGVRAIIPVSGSAYGDGGGGIPGLLLGSPRDDAGNLIMIGEGRQHWATVHVADLADFFRRALEQDSAHGYYAIGNGLTPTVAELTEAAAVAVGAAGCRSRVRGRGAARVSVITSRRCSSSTRARRRPGPASSSAGSPPISDSSRSSVPAATGSSSPLDRSPYAPHIPAGADQLIRAVALAVAQRAPGRFGEELAEAARRGFISGLDPGLIVAGVWRAAVCVSRPPAPPGGGDVDQGVGTRLLQQEAVAASARPDSRNWLR